MVQPPPPQRARQWIPADPRLDRLSHQRPRTLGRITRKIITENCLKNLTSAVLWRGGRGGGFRLASFRGECRLTGDRTANDKSLHGVSPFVGGNDFHIS